MLTDGVSMVIRQTILQLKTPDDMRGRVSSVNSMFVGSSNELGAFESGVPAKLMGTVTAVVFGGYNDLTNSFDYGALYTRFKFRKLDLRKDDRMHMKKTRYFLTAIVSHHQKHRRYSSLDPIAQVDIF